MSAGILCKLGINMGGKTLGKSLSNPLGHFENEDFYNLNKKILKFAGDNWRNSPKGESILAQAEKFKKK